MAIFKRQPVQHKLPTGWTNLDSIKYSNLNQIKGLQHVDNPISADQESTYNCKNVYQDESGNLTVRPAVRPIELISDDLQIQVLHIYDTGAGRIMHTKKSDRYYLEFSENEVEIGSGNIAVQESNGQVFVLYTDIDNKLAFKIFNSSTLIEFDPDIPTNRVDKPISRLYNLLSNQTKYETVLPADGIYSNYSDTQILLDDPDIYTHYDEIYYLKNGDLLVRQGTDIRHYGVRLNTLQLLGEYWTSINSFSDTIVTDSTDSNGIVELYHVYKNDAIADTVVVANTFIDVYNLASESKRENVNVSEHFSLSDYDTVCPVKNGFVIVEDYNLIRPTHSVLLFVNNQYISTHSWNTMPGGLLDDFCTNNKFTVLSSYGNILIFKYTDTGFVTEYRTINYLGIYSIDDDIVYYDAGKVYYDIASGWIKYKTYIGTYISHDERFITKKDSTIYSYDLSETGYTRYDVSELIEDTRLKESNYNATLGIIKSGDDYYIFSRTLLANYVYIDREKSDALPVLSEIEDTVLTSFYLDNIYWFVTKHNIFGTGVAGEQFSIKYFDPMKYFHFDEELTAAIRISDSSFWVFHRNGAYLIYKSTSEIYDEVTNEYTTMITWLRTNTAKSKGCDFDNAVLTLPVNSYVSCVTSDDISCVQMRENVQTDDRILVPITVPLSKFVSSLLNETESVVTGIYKYNALYFLNPVKITGKLPVLIYNTVTESWWYWELPFDKVLQTNVTETNINILANVGGRFEVYDFITEYYSYLLGGITYDLYADRLDNDEPVQIEWFWESAILHFNTVDFKKQLLYTNFTFGERNCASISFDYNFEVYTDKYSERTWTQVDRVVERAKTVSYKTTIAKFSYLQLYLKNRDAELDSFESYTRPKFSTISFKYRLLTGGL